MKKLKIFSLFIFIALLLTACVTILESDTTVTLDKDEHWQVKYNLLFEGASYTEYQSSIEEGIASFADSAESRGITVKTKELSAKNGNVPYEMTLSGTGIDQLNEVLGTTEAFTKETENGETYYRFSLLGSDISTGDLYVGSTADFSFTLEGMEVMSTNGTKKSSTSVTWTDPNYPMTAEIKPAEAGSVSFPWWIILAGVAGVAIIVVVILLATGVFKKKPKTAYGIPPAAAPQYYQQVPPGASYSTMPPPLPIYAAGQATPPPPPPVYGSIPATPPPPPVMAAPVPISTPPAAQPAAVVDDATMVAGTPPIEKEPAQESQKTVIAQRKDNPPG